MNARFGKILLIFLCGVLLFIAGCTSQTPSGGAAPAPTQITSGASAGAPSAVTSTDLETINSYLRSINDELSVIASNTRAGAGGYVTGNIVLFDDQGNTANAVTTGTSLVALPMGSCDIAVFSRTMVSLYVTLEEEKNMDNGGGPDQRYYRNRQTCLNVPMCRRTVQLDRDFSYLYIEYKPYSSVNTLDKVTLSYRCP